MLDVHRVPIDCCLCRVKGPKQDVGRAAEESGLPERSLQAGQRFESRVQYARTGNNISRSSDLQEEVLGGVALPFTSSIHSWCSDPEIPRVQYASA
jgi:hypothetical protein